MQHHSLTAEFRKLKNHNEKLYEESFVIYISKTTAIKPLFLKWLYNFQTTIIRIYTVIILIQSHHRSFHQYFF